MTRKRNEKSEEEVRNAALADARTNARNMCATFFSTRGPDGKSAGPEVPPDDQARVVEFLTEMFLRAAVDSPAWLALNRAQLRILSLEQMAREVQTARRELADFQTHLKAYKEGVRDGAGAGTGFPIPVPFPHRLYDR